jgi:pimeloyl-ACP methyl ester carboxylesterase
MLKLFRALIAFVMVLSLVLVAAPQVSAQAVTPPDAFLCSQHGGTFTIDGEGSNICYWIPALWNRDLVVFAHGYVDPRMEVGIPWDQLLLPDGTSLPGTINKLGYAFAVTSYSKNGLAVKEGVEGVFRLVKIFRDAKPFTRRVFLVGASEGGLVTTLAIERDAQNVARVFSGGMSTCGPVGDFERQVNYWGDFRLIFDHYFPGVIPSPQTVNNPVINISPELITAWSTPQPQPLPAIPGPLQAGVVQALTNNPQAALKLIAVTQAPVDPKDLEKTVGETTLGVLGYNITSTDEGRQELSGDPNVNLSTNLGSPYSNVGRKFVDPDGSPIDAPVYEPDPLALQEIARNYTTSGNIQVPLVGLHTLRDPIVPYWQELLYRAKTLQAGTAWRFINIPVARYGHCNFKASEAIFAFVVMVFRATFNMPPLSQVQAALPDATSQQEFQELVDANPELFGTQIFIPLLRR